MQANGSYIHDVRDVFHNDCAKHPESWPELWWLRYTKYLRTHSLPSIGQLPPHRRVDQVNQSANKDNPRSSRRGIPMCGS